MFVDMIVVNPRHGPRNLGLHHLPRLRLASIRVRNATLLLLVTAQCLGMQDQLVPVQRPTALDAEALGFKIKSELVLKLRSSI